MDEADKAQGEEAAYLGQALSRRKKTLIPVGSCFYCREGVGGSNLFCDLECAREYEREQGIRARQSR